MENFLPDDFDVEINPSEPLFIISVVSELVHIPIWTLRKLDEKGIVCPERIGKKTRCYSKQQIKTLNYIRYLLFVKKVNISGIRIILKMEKEE